MTWASIPDDGGVGVYRHDDAVCIGGDRLPCVEDTVVGDSLRIHEADMHWGVDTGHERCRVRCDVLKKGVLVYEKGRRCSSDAGDEREKKREHIICRGDVARGEKKRI